MEDWALELVPFPYWGPATLSKGNEEGSLNPNFEGVSFHIWESATSVQGHSLVGSREEAWGYICELVGFYPLLPHPLQHITTQHLGLSDRNKVGRPSTVEMLPDLEKDLRGVAFGL
jgi:hypothetical protein